MKNREEYIFLVENRLNELLKERSQDFGCDDMPRLLCKSMRYSLLAGGKRLRPCLTLAACEVFGGNAEDALDFACAMEMIHTYSLIHDDLPGMDNDVLRRGRPTNHVVYGEGQAILAGDGLLNYAFEVMIAASLRSSNKTACLYAMNAIAYAAGVKGMIAGQCADLYAEKEKVTDAALLEYIEKGKTMCMIRGAVLAGACIAQASEKDVEALSRYAYNFGILFQVTDDILDITADEAQFGKSKGKDAEEGKLTAVSIYGLEGAQRLAEKLKDEALKALDDITVNTDYFKELLIKMYERNH